jgi:hypothetical protein
VKRTYTADKTISSRKTIVQLPPTKKTKKLLKDFKA